MYDSVTYVVIIFIEILKCCVGKSPHDIFLDHYDALSNLLSASLTTLIPHFISARILSVSDHEEISALANPNDKALMLLKKISAALQNGYHKSFRDTLSLMRIYGNNDLKELSQNITALLPDKVGMLFYINYTVTYTYYTCIFVTNKRYTCSICMYTAM